MQGTDVVSEGWAELATAATVCIFDAIELSWYLWGKERGVCRWYANL